MESKKARDKIIDELDPDRVYCWLFDEYVDEVDCDYALNSGRSLEVCFDCYKRKSVNEKKDLSEERYDNLFGVQ